MSPDEKTRDNGKEEESELDKIAEELGEVEVSDGFFVDNTPEGGEQFGYE